MQQEKMRLTLIPSKIMDEWAKNNELEHSKVRLAKKARLHYRPTDWQSIYLVVNGASGTKKLRVGQAPEASIKTVQNKDLATIGFVTTKTYKALMSTKDDSPIWVSEISAPITVGCDPEFVLVDTKTGQAVYADTVTGESKYAKVGSDGPCAEIRPDPANDTDTLVENIRTLLKNQTAIINGYAWIGGATFKHPSMTRRYPIGGHIHLGLPNLPGGAQNPNKDFFPRIARILDELIAVPLTRIDTPLPAERKQLGYGKFNDTRHETKGTLNRFEWRVPSGIWLIHADLARAVIGTTKAVTEEIWKKYADRDNSSSFMLSSVDKGVDCLPKAFGCMDAEVVRTIINTSKSSDVTPELVRSIHNRLKNMSSYVRYKEIIDDFISICLSKDMPPTDDKLELRRSWLENKPL